MATPIGTNVVTSLSRRMIIPDITDVIYGANPLTFRFLKRNKKNCSGATQIEIPWMYKRFSNGGAYSGYDVWDVAPNDTVKNGALDWKQHQVPVTIDGLTMIKTDAPDAIADFLRVYFAQAEMELIENLGAGLWSDGTTNTKDIDGLESVVSATGTYAGLARSGNTFLNATVDATAGPLTEVLLQNMHSAVGVGGRQATLIASRREQRNRYITLLRDDKRFVNEPGGHDQMLADAGFSNVLYNGTPWIQDENVPDGPNSSNSAIYFLNEDYLELKVHRERDFYLRDFIQPTDQDAMTASILWAGNLVCTNPARQGKLTNIAS